MPNLVIVSNRLPVSVKKVDGKLEFSPSTGGLATGLSGYTKQRGTKWIGWPGLPDDDLTDSERVQIAKELKKYRCYPLFLSKKQIDDFYNGYSNGVLWPLFHELPYEPQPAKTWQAYRAVNRLFADEVLRLSKLESTIWVHDYQLMLVPQLLRQANRGDTIGFFLHIPFPPGQAFAELPEAKPLLRGILGADLAGFHTRGYTRNFLETAGNQLNVPALNGQVLLGGRAVAVTEFPMGIDYERFAKTTSGRRSRIKARRLRRKYPRQKVIVSVDRLDLTKGLVERLKAYRTLLKGHPELIGKLVMVMIVAPSRTDIPAYKQLKSELDKLLADITASYATPKWQPIDFIYETVPLDDVMAYYQMADIAFITPIRDGMNLVAKEFLASKRHNDGILILSETAGAAEELQDAVMVNPAKPGTMVQGLLQALNMPKRELRSRGRRMNEQLREFSVERWAENFIDSLQQPRTLPKLGARSLHQKQASDIRARYTRAGSRLLLLDYDGTLRSFTRDPADAKPGLELMDLLRRLADDAKNDIMITSGRSKTDLASWFGDLPIALAAEHGATVRRKGGKNWHKISSVGPEWRRELSDVFDHYAELTPGAFTEQKEWAMVWHYRNAKPYVAQKNLVALRRLLRPIARKYHLEVLDGNNILEIRPGDVNKRRAAQEWLIHDHDFIIAAGDDTTDEDMFGALPPMAYSIKVGRGQTLARYRVKNVEEVLALLRLISG